MRAVAFRKRLIIDLELEVFMVKYTKKIIGILLGCLLVFGNTLTIFADSSETQHTIIVDPEINGNEGVIVPFAYEACSGLPYHDMYPKGWGHLHNKTTGETLISFGQCWQCKNCYYVLVTEGNPTYYYPQIIGKYGGASYSEPISTNSNFVYTNYCGYESSTKLNGYNFH